MRQSDSNPTKCRPSKCLCFYNISSLLQTFLALCVHVSILQVRIVCCNARSWGQGRRRRCLVSYNPVRFLWLAPGDGMRLPATTACGSISRSRGLCGVQINTPRSRWNIVTSGDACFLVLHFGPAFGIADATGTIITSGNTGRCRSAVWRIPGAAVRLDCARRKVPYNRDKRCGPDSHTRDWEPPATLSTDTHQQRTLCPCVSSF